MAQIMPDVYQFSEYIAPYQSTNHQYLLLTQKPVLISTGTFQQAEKALPKIQEILGDRPLAYLLVSHFDAVQCGAIEKFLEIYPDLITICSNETAHQLYGFGYQGALAKKRGGRTLEKEDFSILFIEAPAQPNQPAGLLFFEQQRGILFCSNLFSNTNQADGEVRLSAWNRELAKLDGTAPALKELLQNLSPTFLAPTKGCCTRLDEAAIQASRYLFPTPLSQGTITEKLAADTFTVIVDHHTITCHFPAASKIQNVTFDNLPCLFSTQDGVHTIEAIGLPDKTGTQRWCGVREEMLPVYMEYFLRKGLLQKIAPSDAQITTNVPLGQTSVSLRVGETYIDLTMPLESIDLTLDQQLLKSDDPRFILTDHISSRLGELHRNRPDTAPLIQLNCFFYPHPGIEHLPIRSIRFFRHQLAQGNIFHYQMWQANLTIDPTGVTLETYFNVNDNFSQKE